MTKAEVISIISEKTGIDKGVTLATVEAFFETVKEQLTAGEAIYVRGFGSFVNKKRAEKKARNISKNTTVIVPAHYIPTFKPSRAFINSVKENVKVD